MPEVFANTTPLQYLHQLRLLHLLPEFYGIVFIPEAVSAVLSLASLSPAPLLLLDDSAARRYASSMTLPFTGTLGVLIRAFREGRISEIAVVLDRLESLGFRLAPSTRAEALRLASKP